MNSFVLALVLAPTVRCIKCFEGTKAADGRVVPLPIECTGNEPYCHYRKYLRPSPGAWVKEFGCTQPWQTGEESTEEFSRLSTDPCAKHSIEYNVFGNGEKRMPYSLWCFCDMEMCNSPTEKDGEAERELLKKNINEDLVQDGLINLQHEPARVLDGRHFLEAGLGKSVKQGQGGNELQQYRYEDPFLGEYGEKSALAPAEDASSSNLHLPPGHGSIVPTPAPHTHIPAGREPSMRRMRHRQTEFIPEALDTPEDETLENETEALPQMEDITSDPLEVEDPTMEVPKEVLVHNALEALIPSNLPTDKIGPYKDIILHHLQNGASPVLVEPPKMDEVRVAYRQKFAYAMAPMTERAAGPTKRFDIKDWTYMTVNPNATAKKNKKRPTMVPPGIIRYKVMEPLVDKPFVEAYETYEQEEDPQ